MCKEIILAPGEYEIARHNGTAYTLRVAKDVTSDSGAVWLWQVDGQFFEKNEWAQNYLQRRVRELQTGKRRLNYPRDKYPEICSFGVACRLKHYPDGSPMFTMLCNRCPKAEKIKADADGLTLIYEGGDFDV